MTKPLCVIPARAGSKRLAGKNTATVAGKPMLAWTIEAAKQSGIFDAVYVSTEDDTTASIAQQFGAIVPYRRPAALAGDKVTNVAVALHLLDHLNGGDTQYDTIVCLQPTSPLRTAAHIRDALQEFVTSQTDYLLSVTVIDPHYFHWALEQRDGAWAPFFGSKFLTIRQDLPQVFRPNGAIKVAKAAALRIDENFFGADMSVYAMPEDASVHVATKTDQLVADALLRGGQSA